MWINGALTETLTDLPGEGTLAKYHTQWSPSDPGMYTIQTVAYGADGAASPADSARVTFSETMAAPVSPPAPETGCLTPVGGGPTPVSCEAPSSGCPTPVGGGPTPVSCAGPVVQFWADPAEIDAGRCTTIRWHVENVQKVIFGGQEQSFDGSYEDCLCANQMYSLAVTHFDGSQEKPYVSIVVNGTCVTPEPADVTGPPAPEPAVPAHGLSISCKGLQTLAWLLVDDPSGIAEYQVQVQRQEHQYPRRVRLVLSLACAGRRWSWELRQVVCVVGIHGHPRLGRRP